jgi:hypothetical protein
MILIHRPHLVVPQQRSFWLAVYCSVMSHGLDRVRAKSLAIFIQRPLSLHLPAGLVVSVS